MAGVVTPEPRSAVQPPPTPDTLAGDITSDQRQLSLQNRTRGADRKGQAIPVENETVNTVTAQLCSCASAKEQHGASGHQR